MIEPGTWEVDNLIRDRWNAGKEPADIATLVGREVPYIKRRLVALEKWGEVRRGPDGLWSHEGRRGASR